MSLISVVVPIYNVEQYVSQAIESLLHQNGCELEIILVDDGSTDKSGEIAQQYADQHDNIVCIQQKNQGLSAARNTGIDHAHGEYIMFLDSDDTFEEHSIAALKKKMDENCLDLLLFSGKKIFESGREEIFGPQIMLSVSEGYNIYQKLRDSDNYYTCVVFMMLRRQFLLEKNICFARGILHEDHVFAFQVIMSAERAMCISDVVYHYRIRENSIMTGKQNNGKRFAGFEVCLHELRKQYLDTEVENEELNRVFREHMREIGEICAKYYIKMNKEECRNWSSQIQRFVGCFMEKTWSVPAVFRFACWMKSKVFK